MKLDYLNSINSKEDDSRREYLNVMGFSMPKPQFKYLNEKLGTLFSYNIPSSKPTTDNLKIVFGVGSGHDDNLATLNVKIAERKTKPCIVKLSTPNKNTLPEKSGNDLTHIIPMYLADVRKGLTPDYKVYQPCSFTNIWYRKYFTKLANTNIATDLDTETTDSDKLHIECLITKNDINIGPFVNDHEISELCVYAGVNVQVFDKPTQYPPSYYNQIRPKEDLINVVPLFKVQFEPIKLSKIPNTGLLFIFDIDLDDDPAIIPEEEWINKFITDIHAGTGNYGNSFDNINQNQNQDKVQIEKYVNDKNKIIQLSGKLSEMGEWLSTNPCQRDSQHKWFALDFVLDHDSLETGLLWNGDFEITEDVLDAGEGENTITLWLKLDELAEENKVVAIVNKADPSDIETIIIKFVNED